jgi:hypothetical protein
LVDKVALVVKAASVAKVETAVRVVLAAKAETVGKAEMAAKVELVGKVAEEIVKVDRALPMIKAARVASSGREVPLCW